MRKTADKTSQLSHDECQNQWKWTMRKCVWMSQLLISGNPILSVDFADAFLTSYMVCNIIDTPMSKVVLWSSRSLGSWHLAPALHLMGNHANLPRERVLTWSPCSWAHDITPCQHLPTIVFSNLRLFHQYISSSADPHCLKCRSSEY